MIRHRDEISRLLNEYDKIYELCCSFRIKTISYSLFPDVMDMLSFFFFWLIRHILKCTICCSFHLISCQFSYATNSNRLKFEKIYKSYVSSSIYSHPILISIWWWRYNVLDLSWLFDIDSLPSINVWINYFLVENGYDNLYMIDDGTDDSIYLSFHVVYFHQRDLLSIRIGFRDQSSAYAYTMFRERIIIIEDLQTTMDKYRLNLS